MTSKKELIYNSIYKTGFLTAFCLSMSVCGPFGVTGGIITALISAVFLEISDSTLISPMLTGFLIISFAASKAGIGGAVITALSGAVIMFFLSGSSFFHRAIYSSGASGIISLFTAATVTVLVTNIYFGIGATGDTVIDMLRSYRSLGFHPNWRGILYGTIVMVVMITFPRKFKKAKKIINMAFAAILITYILNLFLAPESLVIPFEQVGSGAKELMNLSVDFTGGNLIVIIVSALAFGITAAASLPEKPALISRGITAASSAASSFFCSPVTAEGNSAPSEFLSGIISAVAAALIFIVTNGFERLPAASCAVVLIVAAWQSLDKPSIKRAFKGAGAAVSILIFAASLLTVPALGVLLAFAFALFKSTSTCHGEITEK